MNNEEQQLLNQKRKRAKEKLISDIQANFKTLEEIFKTEKAQNLFNSIGLFSFDEYSKFFQNLANKEYTSMTEHSKKNRNPISIDKSELKFDYTIPQNYEEILPSIKYILKTNLEPRGLPKKIKENLNKVIPSKDNPISMKLYLKAVSDNIDNLINSWNELEPKDFKLLIKTYSNLIRINDNIYFEQDKLFFDLLEKYLYKSVSNFFNLCSYWLYTEFLLCSNNYDNAEIKIYGKRYEEILKNIIQILNKTLDNDISLINYKKEFNTFISNVPLYNKMFIDFIIKFHRLCLDMLDDESIKSEHSITNFLLYLENMKLIYINIINDRNLSEKKDKEEMKKNLLENFLIMTRYKKFLSAKSMTFIFKDIYCISKFEEEVIRQFGLEGLEEIKKYKEVDKIKIDQRFFFYLSLCAKNKENIFKLPSLYEEADETIKDFMNNYNKYIEGNLKGIDQYYAATLISKCGEKSENIVINIIKNIYGNPNYKCEKNIEEEKLYRNIKSYYMKYCPNLIRGVVELANKIPINDFFENYNFILDKIKQNEAKPEIINEIFEQINSFEKNKNILGNNVKNTYNNYDNIKDKIFFYILYYFQNIKKEGFKYYKDLMIKFNIKKIIKMKNESEENFKNELNNISTQFINDNKINLLEIFNIYDEYKENIKNMNEIQKEEIDIIINEFDKNIINIINEKLLVEQSDKLLEEYYNKLSQENKDIFKDKILKNISSQAKGKLDLITFGDI